MTAQAAEEELKGTYAADKNEILWKRFGVNYNGEAEVWRKGSVVFRDLREREVKGDDELRKVMDEAETLDGLVEVGRGAGATAAAAGEAEAPPANAALSEVTPPPKTGSSTPLTTPGSGCQPSPSHQSHPPTPAISRTTPKTPSVASLSKDRSSKPLSKTQQEKQRKRRAKAVVTIEHVDIIKDMFWDERPWILVAQDG